MSVETVAQVAGMAGAVVFAWLAFKFFAKEKYPTSVMFGLVAAVCLLCSFPWFQGLAKTLIMSKVNSQLESLGQQVNAIQASTATMQKELGEHQGAIDKNQKELAGQQTRIRTAQTNITAQQESITNQYAQIAQLQATLTSAQTNIAAQQERLADVTYWVNNLFSNTTNETIALADTNRVIANQLTNGIACLCITLRNVPIRQSIQASVYSSESFNIPQPITAPFGTYGNLLIHGLVGYNLKTSRLRIQYVKDTRRTNVTDKVYLQGNSFFLGNRLLGGCDPNHSFIIEDGP